jgi:YHS domain-containing protein
MKTSNIAASKVAIVSTLLLGATCASIALLTTDRHALAQQQAAPTPTDVRAPSASTSPASTKSAPAIRGYDPVAYFTDGKAIAGNSAWQVSHDGETYQFASAASRDAFVAAPKRYAPQYGGYCAYGATRGYKAAVDPTAFKIVDGKLYLNYSEKVQTLWSKDVAGNIKLADEKWPETAKTTKVMP